MKRSTNFAASSPTASASELAILGLREIRAFDGRLFRLDNRQFDGTRVSQAQSEQETGLDGIRTKELLASFFYWLPAGSLLVF